ncbi:sensor histidine kinase [Amycolatopsis sp. NPDC059027]|uniref:sensor histidine kinase n=1 Tax=unclassified Amycolatopsis TaxID=2618356 RepID=UPI0036730EDA
MAGRQLRHAPRRVWSSFASLAIGFLTAMASWLVVCALLICTLLVFTLPLLPLLMTAVRRLIAVDRWRVSRYTGRQVPERYQELSGPFLGRVVTVLSDPATRRDLLWLLVHPLLGIPLSVLTIGLPGAAVQNFITSLVWWLVPGGMKSSFGLPVTSWPEAALNLGIAVAAALVSCLVLPLLATGEAHLARALLSPPKASMAQRVAELTATRAAALEAHGAELRRIERDLHDGTQNRLVAVVMMLGIAERGLRRDPASALPLVLKAQNAASDAIAELRDVVRSIHPPVLEDRGLDGAVDALAARSPIPCTVDVESLRRLPAAVEAAAYFVVAEALTNVAKHSGAEHASVRLAIRGDVLTVEVTDDGHGGADEDGGTGLNGIRRRVEAFDGHTELSSPVGGPTVLRAVLPTGA